MFIRAILLIMIAGNLIEGQCDSMAIDTILQTKLFMPSKRPFLVSRPSLLNTLHAGLDRKLTLISAPAGFGKTTIVTSWVADCGQPVAWLSLDSGDNDPARFLAYVVAAIQQIEPAIGGSILGALQSPQSPPLESLLTTLINELATTATPFVLVLDDYHVIDTPQISEALGFLLEHLPTQMHLVITTREDPPLPLPRLRVRGELTELRAADLRFSEEETAVFLNQTMGLELSATDIAILEKRTEGWIAGLQLAALSLRGDEDKDRFMASFSGSHHFILDYLIAEVLQQQPTAIQKFLYHASILERFCGPLIEAVTDTIEIQDWRATEAEQPANLTSQEILLYLEQTNLFMTPLDNQRHWYRFHHLFADLLRQRLEQQADIDVALLHQRASQWFEANNLSSEAFYHAAAANDIERAERLLEGGQTPLYFQGAVGPIERWLASLPNTILNKRPALWVIYAAVLTVSGRPIEQVKGKLAAAEEAMRAAPTNDSSKGLAGRMAAIRAMLAIPNNEIETLLVQAQQAIELLHPDDLTFRATVTMSQGYAYLLQGELDAAERAYQETVAYSQASQNVTFALAGYIGLGNVQEAENKLYLAEATYQRVIEVAGTSPLPYVGAAYLGLTQISYAWNDWASVIDYAKKAIQFGSQMVSVDIPAACHILLARTNMAQNDFTAAEQLLAEAEQLLHDKGLDFAMADIVSARVQLFLRRGDVVAAAQLGELHSSPLDKARIHLANGQPALALQTLEDSEHQMLSPQKRLPILVVKTLAWHAQGDNEQSASLLRKALSLAERGGLLRVFADEGPLMFTLLQALAGTKTAVSQTYLNKLFAAFAAETAPSPASQPLIEPLSQRELEVLHLIAQGLSNREIGQRLFLALDTVKGHNRKIFGKLNVQRRTEAVARARELGLL